MLGKKHFSKRTPKSNTNLSFKAMGKSMQQLAVCFTNNNSLSKSLNLVVDENNKTQLIQLLQNCSWKCNNLYWKIEARKPPDWHGNVYRMNHLEICNVSLFIIIIIRVIPDSLLNTLLLIPSLEQSDYAGIHLVCTCHLLLLTL